MFVYGFLKIVSIVKYHGQPYTPSALITPFGEIASLFIINKYQFINICRNILCVDGDDDEIMVNINFKTTLVYETL